MKSRTQEQHPVAFLSGLGSWGGHLTGCWQFVKWHHGVVASYHCCVAVDDDYRAADFALNIKNRMRMLQTRRNSRQVWSSGEGGAGTRELFLALEGCPGKEQLRMEGGEGYPRWLL